MLHSIFFYFWQVQSSIHNFLFHKYIFDFSVTLHTCFNTFWVPVAPLFCHCRCQLGLVLFSGDALILKWEKWHQPTILLFRPPPFPCRPSLPQQTKTRPLLSHTHAQKYTDELIALSPIVSHVFVFISDTLPSIWNKSPCFHQYSSKHLNPALTWTDYPCSTLFFLWWNIIWSKSQKGIKKTFLHFSAWLLGLGCVRTMTGQPV